MVILAKFGGVCEVCGERFLPGVKIEWNRGSKSRHVACETTVQEAAAVGLEINMAPAVVTAKPASTKQRDYLRSLGRADLADKTDLTSREASAGIDSCRIVRISGRSNYTRNWYPCGYPGCTQGQHCDDCDGEGGGHRSY